MKKLIAIDMDGTLLSDHKSVSKENVQAIKEAIDLGHIAMICSGRAHEDIQQFLSKHNLHNLPHAGSNGAIAYVDDEVIYSTPMNTQVAKEIYSYLVAQKYPFKIYTNQGIFTQPAGFVPLVQVELDALVNKEEKYDGFIEMLQGREVTLPSVKIESFATLQTMPNMEIYKFFVFTPNQEKKAAFSNFIAPQNSVAATSSGVDNIEVMDKHAHKGTALIEMAKYYNIPIENTIAIGDNFNDVPMLKIAGMSVAMANGEENVKQLADKVTVSNAENGVAKVIREYMIGK